MNYLIAIILAFMTITGWADDCCEDELNHWYVEAGFGVAQTKNININNKLNAVGRLSLGDILIVRDNFKLGLEAGIQNGNALRLFLPKESIDSLGGMPINAQLKPPLDVLATLHINVFEELPVYLWVKGGAAYQHLHVDRDSVNDVHVFSPEIMAGLSYMISEQASINLGVQSIWGYKPQLTVNLEKETALLRNIPARQAVMLGFSFYFL